MDFCLTQYFSINKPSSFSIYIFIMSRQFDLQVLGKYATLQREQKVGESNYHRMVVLSSQNIGTQMQKFKQQGNPSRFSNYIINNPHSTRRKPPLPCASSTRSRPLSITDSSHQQETLLQASNFNRLSSKLSVRSSKGRTDSLRVNRREAINRQMTKNTIRRMKRFNTQQIDPAHDQNVATLKSKVNHFNAACNQVKKNETLPVRSQTENYAREQRKKFLMGQLCFTEIDEERIEKQRKYLTNFQHLSRSKPKMVRTDSKNNTSNTKPKVDRQTETHLLSCLRAIDRIFLVLKQMEFAGFPFRNNRFVIDYCTEGRMWLKRVFLAQVSDRTDAFSMAVKYSVAASPEAAKRNLTEFLAVAGNQQPLEGYLQDIEGLYEHLESSLTEKRLSKLMNAGWALDGRSGALGQRMRAVIMGHNDASILRLTTDLEQIQTCCGPMREITKIGRRKFDELSRSYSRLQALI